MGEEYKVVSLFCGCGGLDLGFEKAGIEHKRCEQIYITINIFQGIRLVTLCLIQKGTDIVHDQIKN